MTIRDGAPLRWLLAPMFLVLVLLAVSMVTGWLAVSNVREPWRALDLDYLAGLLGAVVLALFILACPMSPARKPWLLLLWLAKVTIVLGPMLAYEAQYDVLDAYTYHDQARLAAVEWTDLALGHGALLVIWIVQGLHSVLPESYHLAKVFFAFAGLLGVYLLWRGVSILSGTDSVLLLLIIGLFPGVLFWSSILGKDPIVLLGIGGAMHGAAKYIRNGSVGGFISMLVFVAVAAAIRPWMGLILLLPALVVIVLHGRSTLARRWCMAVGLGFIAAGLSGFLYQRFALGTGGGVLERIDHISRAWASGGSGREPPSLDSWAEVLTFMPVGAFTALFRPLPGETPGVFGLLAGVESVFLLVLSGVFLVTVRIRDMRRPTILLLLGILFLWLVAYAFVSYQNLGTAVRFRAQILPVALALFLHSFWQRAGIGEGDEDFGSDTTGPGE